MRAILLAAGQGKRLRPLTSDRPKCMVEVGGAPLLDWQLHALRTAGVEDITVVRGWCRATIHGRSLRTIDNPRWSETNMVASLHCALDRIGCENRGETLVVYTDLLYRPAVVQAARQSRADIGVVVDMDWRALWEKRMSDPLSDAETLRFDEGGRLLEIGQKPNGYEDIQAQYIGMIKLSAAGCETLSRTIEQAAKQPKNDPAFGSAHPFDRAAMTDLLQGLIDLDVPLKTIPIHGGWTEVDSLDDRDVAEQIVRENGWSVPVTEVAMGDRRSA